MSNRTMHPKLLIAFPVKIFVEQLLFVQTLKDCNIVIHWKFFFNNEIKNLQYVLDFYIK